MSAWIVMYPHRIRLRGPWLCTPAGQTPHRASVPCRFAESDLIHLPILMTRKFGYPGRIDSHERVWLTLTSVNGSARLTLNDHPLGQARGGPFAAEITALLRPHNQLDLLVHGDEVGEVALEVRATAFLQGVRARRLEGKLRVEGTVVGVCEQPLDLYFLVDGRNAHYQTIHAGEVFATALEAAGDRVRVELIHVSTVWYAVDLVVAD